MNIWASYTALTFTEVNNSNDADILISWESGDHSTSNEPNHRKFYGPGIYYAHTSLPPPNGPTPGDIHFDKAENWTLNQRPDDSQPIDLFTIALHELGHSIGLRHSQVSASLMEANYNGSQRFLSPDDITGIQSLYPPIAIQGAPLICSSNEITYNLTNLEGDETVTWSSSSNIQIVSSTNSSITIETFSSSSEGSIAADIVVNSNGDVKTTTKEIRLGGPDVSDYDVETLWNFDIETNTVSSVGLTSGAAFPENTEFDWEILPLNNSNCSQADFQDGNTTPSLTTTTSDPAVPVFWGTCGAYYTIKCWAKNDCGKSYVGEVNVIVKEVDCVELHVSPNPAGGRIAQPVSLQLVLLPPCDKDGGGGGGLPEPGVGADLSIFDLQGNERYNTHYSTTSEGMQIPGDEIAELSPGTYILRLNTENNQGFNTMLIVGEN